jgi:hypothetical protein
MTTSSSLTNSAGCAYRLASLRHDALCAYGYQRLGNQQ